MARDRIAFDQRRVPFGVTHDVVAGIGQDQLTFLTQQFQAALAARQADTKNQNPQALIITVHHPPFTGSSQHFPSATMLAQIDACSKQAGIWPDLVLSGHDHIYERITPQKGIYYFVEGASGQLRKGDANRSAMNAKSFDQDMTFMVVEIAGNQMSFQTISRSGATVDSGTVQRQVRVAP